MPYIFFLPQSLNDFLMFPREAEIAEDLICCHLFIRDPLSKVLSFCGRAAGRTRGFECRVLHLVDKRFSTWAMMPPPFFALVCFLDRFLCFLLRGAASDHEDPTSTSCLAGITSRNHQAQLHFWDKVLLTFALPGLEPCSSLFYLLCRWEYRPMLSAQPRFWAFWRVGTQHILYSYFQNEAWFLLNNIH
jgi:hypothetical protein